MTDVQETKADNSYNHEPIGVVIGYSEDGFPLVLISGMFTNVTPPKQEKQSLLKRVWKLFVEKLNRHG